VDAYNINVSGRFSQSSTFTVTPAIQAQLIAQGVPGAATYTAVNFFTNDFDTRTRGVDVVGSYAQHIGPGRMELMAAFNENQTKVTSGSLAANPAQKATFEKGIPQQNMSASASYAVGPVKVLGRVRYYGSWTDSTGNTTGELLQSFGSINMVDVAASYDVLYHLTVTVGADNVFNSYPDQATFQASRGLIYSRNSPYSTDGGLYYVRLNARF
jgi:iron complex outermembrane receptor protein